MGAAKLVHLGLTDGNIRHIDMAANDVAKAAAGVVGRTPVKGLYLCGAGTHRTRSHGSPGHNAAHVVLEELGK